ncbi:unnamed protein product [Effrenium voratum]|uniref:Carotenoid biosynthesis protein n=1 Tax=Effrenium voratum TaxID=2562239 RepID=A0AA36HP64_9DINO|nr:unnamed protein product [Effrenium voratum]CAJ1426493.1 unnamed protein product [Effrenium voratum]
MVPLWSVSLVFGLAVVAALMRHQYELGAHGGFFPIAGVLAVAGCMAENSCISWYRYYSYSPDWGLFLGYVPLHVVLIWPLFILGEHQYLRRLLPLGSLGLRACFCFVDTVLLANLVEIYCVSAGLWSWRESNCLGVPLMGPIGWALFATPAVLLLAVQERATRMGRTHRSRILAIPLVCMVVLHVGLWSLWNSVGKHLSNWSFSPSFEAAGICAVQLCYEWAARSKASQGLALQKEVPRLLACGIVAALWLLKGTPDPGICLVSLASLLRLLAFRLA